MINELTPQIKAWLETEPEKRDIAAGAELLLRINRNHITYANIMRCPQMMAPILEKALQDIYNQRLRNITHEQVKAMMAEVEVINKTRNLDGASSESTRLEWQKGKRADHDELPEEIQALYVKNGELMHRMRDLHTKLRLISPLNSSCPDSDRFPLAKMLIDYDRVYRDNWNKYDHYIKGTPVASVVLATDARTVAKNAAKMCNLLLGKYAKTPTDALAERIRETYKAVENPTDNLVAKMKAAELL